MSTKSNLEPAIHRPLHGNRTISTKDLLREIVRELADSELDLRTLLRGVAAALQIASTTGMPVAGGVSRKVWNYQEREAYRSRTTWEKWILSKKLPHLRDKQ